MTGVTCRWLEETAAARVGLRRYQRGEPACPSGPGGTSYHQALAVTGIAAIRWSGTAPGARCSFRDAAGRHGQPDYAWPGHDDPRWPAACACGYQFTEDDPWQEWSQRLYQDVAAGELTTLRDAPDGAMWDAWWLPEKGTDGRSLVVRLPGGHEWSIDSRASNCTLPHDSEHRCWVRHGTPPVITVGKDGCTCAAGAGSVQAENYHGFLRNGVFDP